MLPPYPPVLVVWVFLTVLVIKILTPDSHFLVTSHLYCPADENAADLVLIFFRSDVFMDTVLQREYFGC